MKKVLNNSNNKKKNNNELTSSHRHTLPKSSTPYNSLTSPAARDLLTIVHYTLLFHPVLALSPHHLLFPTVEHSLLRAHGHVFNCVAAHVYKWGDRIENTTLLTTNSATTLLMNDEDDDNHNLTSPSSSTPDNDEEDEHEHEHTTSHTNTNDNESIDTSSTINNNNTTTNNHNKKKSKSQLAFISILSSLPVHTRLNFLSLSLSHCASTCPLIRPLIIQESDGKVLSSTRLRSTTCNRDGNHTSYMWIRGAENCASGRVIACYNNRPSIQYIWAGNDLLQVASTVEKRALDKGSRLDQVTATWLRDRHDVARSRGQGIVDEVERDRRRKEEIELEKERKRKSSLNRIGVDQDGCVMVDGEKVDTEDFGRGRRQRKSVSYVERAIFEGLDELGDDEEEEEEEGGREGEEGGEEEEEENDKKKDGDYGHEEDEDEEEEEEDGDGIVDDDDELVIRKKKIVKHMDLAERKRRRMTLKQALDIADDGGDDDLEDDVEDDDDDDYGNEGATKTRRGRNGRRLKRGASEHRAEGRRRVEVDADADAEDGDMSSSRAARAARRGSLKM